MAGVTADADALKPYVPQLLIDWLREIPDARHQAVEGTLALVDVAGFTQLTERLSRRGRVGAEEMSDTLDRTFAELLSVAYDYGAGLVKWGGDAVLLLFRGDEHAPRACAGAAGMRRALRTLGRNRTAAGSAQLRISVGVHSGVFDFFLVGDLHRELLITGPGASRTVAMQQVADAGEVALSPGTAALLAPGILGKPKGDGILLRRKPAASRTPQEMVGPVADLPLADCLPIAIRDHLLRERGEAEHRTATVAFVEFSGVDELLVAEGAEATADALHECVSTVQHATQRHRVTFFETDISRGGGKIMLVAGAPTTVGNDQERMLRALRSVADAGVRLPLRIGVNCGRVFSGDFGPPLARTYSVKGDAINLAARLMARAAAGQILATEAVLTGSRAAFETEALAPFPVKGKAEPIHASVVGPLVRGRRAETRGAKLVGRERELSALLLALESAREWEGRLVELVGEPGIGKSRLVEEVRSRAADVLVLDVACEEYESATPYHPFRLLLRELLELTDSTEPDGAAAQLEAKIHEVAPHLAPRLPLLGAVLDLELPATAEMASLDERFRKPRLEETVRELLGIVLTTPTLLVFEDVHWLDDASSDLLSALTEGIEFRPWLVIATRRETPTGFRAATGGRVVTIHVGPLAVASAAELVEAATDELPLTPQEVEALVERSGGNPLFLGQLVSRARQAGGVESLPDSLESLLAAQVDRVSPHDRTVLRTASVLGISFDEGVLVAALGSEAGSLDDGLWTRLAGLVVRESDSTLRFCHALVRDAAYEGLPYRRRRELHGRVGATIESRSANPEEQAELLSLHFFHAGKLDLAWRYARIAGDRAQSMHAYAEAEIYHERALAAARRLASLPETERARVTEALGEVRFRLGKLEQAATAFRAARGVEGSERERARLMIKEAYVPIRQGRHTAALRWIRRALRALEGLTDAASVAQRAELCAWHGTIRLRQGRLMEAEKWCRRAIDEGTAVDALDALANAYKVLDAALFTLGRRDEAVYSARALAIYEKLGNSVEQGGVLNNLGSFAYYEGRWDDAEALYTRAQDVWAKGGDRWAASFATVNRGEILADQGRLEEAEPLFRAGLRIARAEKTPTRVAEVARFYARMLAQAGRFEEARALLDEAREVYETNGPLGETIVTDARIAEALMLEGRAQEAAALADETLRRAESQAGLFHLVATLQRIRGCALMQQGELGAAEEALTASIGEARTKQADHELALALDSLATLKRLTVEPTVSLEAERDSLLSRLGIVATARIPLGGPSVAAVGS